MKKSPREKFFTEQELTVLSILEEKRSEATDKLTGEISELVARTGIRDSDEILRALYTLEGKMMVSPEPQGDFTSNKWFITDQGLKALHFVRSED